MTNIVDLLDEPDTTVAVVGATDNPSKYGSIIYRDLKRKGYRVFPVNPNRSTVDGDRAYDHLQDLDRDPTIVNIVVPTEVTLEILGQCLEMGLMNVWLQPGTESPESMGFLQRNNFNYLANACIMVESRMNA